MTTTELNESCAVAYAENFHGGVH